VTLENVNVTPGERGIAMYRWLIASGKVAISHLQVANCHFSIFSKSGKLPLFKKGQNGKKLKSRHHHVFTGQSFFFEVKSSPLVKRKAGNVSAKLRTTETATTTITATRATTTYDGAHPLCVDENH
jgi:hypothetical protein